VAQERGDHAAAVRLLGEARELAPKSPQIYLNLGYSNDALNLTAEAERNYRHFLSMTEGDNSYAEQRKHVIKRLDGKR
jgi:Flp pilus assembly protein TadD